MSEQSMFSKIVRVPPSFGLCSSTKNAVSINKKTYRYTQNTQTTTYKVHKISAQTTPSNQSASSFPFNKLPSIRTNTGTMRHVFILVLSVSSVAVAAAFSLRRGTVARSVSILGNDTFGGGKNCQSVGQYRFVKNHWDWTIPWLMRLQRRRIIIPSPIVKADV